MYDFRKHGLTRTLLSAAATLSLAAAAHAVTPGSFSHTTEADFANGDAYGTVVTNLGDIKLSSDTTPLEGLPEDVERIYDVVKVGKVIYVAAGTSLLKVDGGAVEVVASFTGEQVFSIYSVGGRLLLGVSSYDSARLAELKDGIIETLAELPETSYIWDIAETGKQTKTTKDDTFVLATGAPGKVFAVKQSGGDANVLLECEQSNVLSLAVNDREGLIYAGTDTDGLVYRIDAEGNPFVVYDAFEPEIAALVIASDGMLYAGTASAEQAKPGRLVQPVKDETGRPDVQETPEVKPEAEPADKPKVEDKPEVKDEPKEEIETKPEAEKAAPTSEEYDALREKLREKLEAARDGGAFNSDVQPGKTTDKKGATPARPSRAKPAAPSGGNKKGNGVYRIAPDGYVSEVFRESAMILAIVPHEGKLIVATGNEGQVFSVDPDLRETTVLADLDSAQVTCATQTDEGLLLGAANPGALIRMDTAIAEQGGYTSQVLDAGQVSLFGTFKLTADIPKGTTVAIELRSGNVGDPEQAAWSKWAKPVLIKHDPKANPLQPREIKLDAPPARYLQYRLTFTGNGKATATVDQAEIAYVAPNTPPTVTKLVVTAPAAGQPGSDPDPKYNIQWTATDDNKDRLVYTLEYKPGKSDRYLPLAKDLTANKYAWQTQHVPDGWYTFRVTALDKLDNPATSAKSGGRVSEAVLIDNTAPTLNGLKAKVDKNGSVVLSATVNDELSSITSVAYSVDGSDTYQASLPEDLIYDSTSEAWGVTIPDLSSGGHVIAIRAIDARGNTAYRQLIVDVD